MLAKLSRLGQVFDQLKPVSAEIKDMYFPGQNASRHKSCCEKFPMKIIGEELLIQQQKSLSNPPSPILSSLRVFTYLYLPQLLV
jgi:hypothetical protein